MSILGAFNEQTQTHQPLSLDFNKEKEVLNQISPYKPNLEENKVRQAIVDHFRLSDVIMRKPRRKFNDLSVITRMQVDQMAFNTYQENNGESLAGDEINEWKSKAMRPIVRNKVVSIAAHATAQLIFPKVFAYDKATNDDDQKGAQVMEDLMEWAADQSNYLKTNLYATIASLVNPASIVFTEYANTYQRFKTEKGDNGWKWEQRLDEDSSGFQDTVVPVDELYISNFYEHNIQKQDWLIWRRVQSYSQMESKYFEYPNFKYVKAGVQLIYNDANQTFYEVYDANMRQEMCEEIIYWNRAKDLKIIMVNGVMLTDYDNPNPRQDKLYPFVKFGYELIDEGKCFYYKSLAFKMQQDANIINTLYPMIIDGTYLSLMPPMVNRGSEAIGSEVIVPGAVTTLSNPESNLEAIQVSQNLAAGMNTLMKVEESIGESSEKPLQIGAKPTAYAIAAETKEQQVILGLFIQMMVQFIKDYGRLRLGDIFQYLTIGEVSDIEGSENAPLVYKTFMLHDKNEGGKMKTKKIQFDASLPTEAITKKKKLDLSYETLEKQGGIDSNTSLYRVSPELFRNRKFTLKINPQSMTPLTEEAERAFGLELYDRAIANPIADQEQIFRDFLLGQNPISKKDPDKYVAKQQSQPQMPQLQGMQGMPQQGQPQGIQPQLNRQPQLNPKLPLQQIKNNIQTAQV